MSQSGSGTILGLDIGSNSVGWALLKADFSGKAAGLLCAGVRIFDAGVEGDVESGRDQSRGIKRREARLHRRMLARRSRRLRKLARLLQAAGLLPAGDVTTSEGRNQLFTNLDATLFPEDVRKSAPHILLYRLRAQALDRKLSLHELGRAIYHLAQRRGFLSNRKVVAKGEDEEEGKVTKAIGELEVAIKSSGARTLGEYFSRLDTAVERIRARWTARRMFLDEFERIWATQQHHHPGILTEEFKKKTWRAIFHQRPLRWDRGTIGHCELESGRRRAPLALLDIQRFRLLQKVNDLRVFGCDDRDPGKPNLSAEERAKLVTELEAEGDLTFPRIRRLLGFPKGANFNYEEGGEKKLIGNRTGAKLRKIFGNRWDVIPAKDKSRIVEDVLSIQKLDTQRRRGITAWQLEGKAADAFGDLAFEPGHCNLSRTAVHKLLPLMERGLSYATSRKQLYGDRSAPASSDTLPPLDRASIADIRNPAVSRALTEVRKVVNAIIRKHGKPAFARIELARDLRRSREDRKKVWKRNLDNRQSRDDARQRILEEAGIRNPSGTDIEKWLLAVECGWQCPYTGKSISHETLFGPHPQFDVEHIVPFSRCLDNSFMNKTLCHLEENRNVKRNRTPWEAYGATTNRWEEIVQRVKAFRGDARAVKLERFHLKDLESFDDFSERQLSDTRYASRQAIEYLALLYGTGAQGVDADHTRRVQAGRGAVTRYLRDELGLNRILGDGGGKNREDHCHHAVDAVCIALTDARIVKTLSEAAERAVSEGRRRFGRLRPPWPGFFEDVKAVINGLVVSHRVSRKVNGPLHDETLYSKLHKDEQGRECVHIRKRLESLSKGELDRIVDPHVRRLVMDKLGVGEPRKVFAERVNHPRMTSGVPIHAVRVRVYDRTMAIGQGVRQRRVISGSNHHVEIITGKGGKWEGLIVSTFEAMRRLKAGGAIIKREHGPDNQFVFSLCGGDIIEIDEPEGRRGLYVIRTITQIGQGKRVEYVRVRDARKKKDIMASGDWKTSFFEPLRKLNCRKVVVTCSGEVRRAND